MNKKINENKCLYRKNCWHLSIKYFSRGQRRAPIMPVEIANKCQLLALLIAYKGHTNSNPYTWCPAPIHKYFQMVLLVLWMEIWFVPNNCTHILSTHTKWWLTKLPNKKLSFWMNLSRWKCFNFYYFILIIALNFWTRKWEFYTNNKKSISFMKKKVFRSQFQLVNASYVFKCKVATES